MPINTINLNNAGAHAHRRIVDVLNQEFGTNYQGWQNSAWPVANGVVVWFPTLTESTEDHEGWRNVLLQGGQRIETEFVGDYAHANGVPIRHHLGFVHIVFARDRENGDRTFIGVFNNRAVNNKFVYERISTQVSVDLGSGAVTW